MLYLRVEAAASGSKELFLFQGVLFAVAISVCLLAFGRFGKAQAVYFAVVCSAAWPVSNLLAFDLASRWYLPLGEARAYEAAYFVGGALGGLLVTGAASLLMRPSPGPPMVAVVLLIWSITGAVLGGFLGVVGWRLAPSLGAAMAHTFYQVGLLPRELGDPTRLLYRGQDFSDYSLYVVWQTGIAFAVGLIALCRGAIGQIKHPAKAAN